METKETVGTMDADLKVVREMMSRQLIADWMPSGAKDMQSALVCGKMLRARLTLRIGRAAGTSPDVIHRAAAAIEMVHGASLLHDDVIDGGRLRRGAPSFWTRHGVSGAILVGDLLLCEAAELLRETGDTRLTDELMTRTAEMCRAEVEQEMFLRGLEPDWESSLGLARRKTGSLFAFAAFAAGVGHPVLAGALREAGYLAGTAYQLSDDLLDAIGEDASAGKTLGQDSTRMKTTAMTASRAGVAEIPAQIEKLRAASRARVAEWPDIERAWTLYWSRDLCPALDRNTAVTPSRSNA